MELSMTNETTRIIVSPPDAVIVFLEQEITKTLQFVDSEGNIVDRVDSEENAAPSQQSISEP
jgi:hypothetical protein